MNIRGFAYGALCAALLLSLAGCAELSETIENYAMEQAGITQNEDYQSYQNMQNKGELDENGHYQGDETIELEGVELPKGDVKISFAKNSCLDVEYFSDAAYTQPIKGNVWYLNAGDSVYAKTPAPTVAFTDFYEFDRFLLYTYDSDGSRSEFSQENTEDGLVLRIPEEWDGSAFSVVPIGKYLNRTIQLDDYTETDGTRSELHGKWTVNGKKTTDSEISVSPVASCTIDYEYDSERYHVVEVYPEKAFQTDGFICFESVSGIDKISVKLVPYEKIDLRVILDDSVKSIPLDMITADVNENLPYDKDAEKDGNGRVAFDSRTEIGSSIEFSTSGKLSADYALKFAVKKTDDGGKEYTSTQYMSGSAQRIHVDLYGGEQDQGRAYKKITVTVSHVEAAAYTPVTVENGTVTLALKEDGRELTGGAVLEKKSEVTVTIKPKDGYYISGSNEASGAYSETMKFEKWEKDQQKILAAHPIQKAMWVTLNSEDGHGLCVYKLNDEVVSGKVRLEDGQKLELTYSLTDEEYEIDRGWWDPYKYFSSGSKTASITVSADLDGKTLTPADFGIELKKKEG